MPVTVIRSFLWLILSLVWSNATLAKKGSLLKRLHKQELLTCFAEVQESVLEFSAKTGLLDMIGKDNVFSTVEEAVNYIETR